jgi:hypothetical protein
MAPFAIAKHGEQREEAGIRHGINATRDIILKRGGNACGAGFFKRNHAR